MLLSAQLVNVALFGVIIVTPAAFAQVPLYGQCGGQGYTGQTTCVSSAHCVVSNQYYSQCLPGSEPGTVTVPPSSTSSPQPSSTSSPQPSATSLKDIGRSIGWKYVGSATNGPKGNCTDQTYASIFLQQFNMATTGTAMNWREIEPSQGSFNFTMAESLVNWALGSGVLLRGQPLVWHAELPNWLTSSIDLKSAISTHIKAVVGRYIKLMYSWDVVNEVFLDDGSFRPSIFYNQIGPTYVDLAFQAARAADPYAKLYINEEISVYPGAKATAVINLAKGLASRGIVVDGIGIQAHFEVGKVPSSLAAALSQMSQYAGEVAITELDIRVPLPATDASLAQQKKDYQTVFAACKQVPKCVGVTIWGLTDKYSWIPKAYSSYGAPLPWDADYNLKPAYAGAVAGMLTY